MAKDTLGNITTLAEIAVLGGLAYLGYKVLEGFGFFKKKEGGDPGDKTPGTIIPENSNPLLEYVAKQPDKLIPTGTDLSKLTPGVAVPVIGNVRVGLPDVVAGTSARIANAVSTPILGPLWAWSMERKFGQDWQSKLKWTDKGWQKLTPNDVNFQLAMKSGGLTVGTPTNRPVPYMPGVEPKYGTPALKVEAPVSQVKNQLVPLAATMPAIVNIQDVPKQTFQETRDYLLKIPEGTPVTNGGRVGVGGITDDEGLKYATGYGGVGNTRNMVEELLHPVIAVKPAEKPVYGMPGGGVLAGNATEVPKEATVLIPAKPAEVVRAEPITAYVPPPTPVQSVAANPAMGSVPGIVYVNWQNYQVSKVPITGFGWLQLTEAEAKARGFIK